MNARNEPKEKESGWFLSQRKEMEDKGFFISPTDQKIYDSMKKQYPDLVAQADTTAFGNPETQQWFETNLA